ncbi:MAG: FprA family A-type flavoprotein [Lachnospiraceae bacterium]|nr:FprA family A-type flavoprotein [Lachnospiraceae bacterium]
MFISEDIKYIGVDDTDLDLFESQYVVPEGVSYNSYLILDEKIAVMDTADQRKTAEWLENLEKELSGKTPDYLVISHLEPDHSGSLGVFLEKYPNVTIVASAKAVSMLPQFVTLSETVKTEPKKEGETLTLGKHTLTFMLAPMVHWPEVMCSYDDADKVLFSADGFGKFGALSETPAITQAENPELDLLEDWACEARRYYFNICGKYGGPVQALLKKASALEIQTICPLHGPVITENLEFFTGLYNTWSSYKPETEGVFIAYASIHGNTAGAAQELAKMLEEKGVRVAVSDLSRDDMAEAVEDAFRHDRLVLAASSYDAGVFSPMQDFLYRLGHKAFQSRKVALIENGSWAPSAARTMKAALEGMKDIEILEKVVTIKTTVTDETREELKQLAEMLV